MTSHLDWTLPAGKPLQISGLCGEWANTDRSGAGGVLGLTLTEQDGELWLRGLGMARPVAYAWHPVRATSYAPAATSTQAWSFLADCDFGFMRTIMSAYHKAGILIATTYNLFGDGSRRADYWTREFFHRRAAAAPPATTAPRGITRDRDRSGDGASGGVDASGVVGRWVNFDPSAPGITAATVRAEGDQLAVVIDELGREGVRRWPALPGRATADQVTGGRAIGFVATGDVFAARVEGPHRATLCAYVNRGLLTIDAHAADLQRKANVMTRTHLYLVEEGTV